MPVKKTPDITDIIGEKEVSGKRYKVSGEEVESEPIVGAQNLAPSAKEKEGERKDEREKEKEEARRETEEKFLLLSEEKVADDGLPAADGRGDEEQSDKSTETQPQSKEEPLHTTNLAPHTATHTPQPAPDFPTHWRTMFNHVFASVPTIYFSLKETLPEIENNIIKVVVKNDIQKEHFEAKIRDVLEFLRTNFNEQVEEIIVEANEQLETKKIIYDVKDKLQNFKEQNSEFDDFIQILELKIKD